MDDRNRTNDRGNDALLTAALLLLVATTGAAFGRIFAGSAPAPRFVLVAGVAVGLGALVERRHLALSVAVSAVGLLTAIGLFVFPTTTWHGAPTLATLEMLGHALGNLGERAVEEAAPARPIPALFAPSLIAMWSAAYAAHALAARAGSPLLGIVPPAALLAFAGVIAEDGSRPGYAAIFLVAALAVLYAAGMRQLDRWGPVLPRGPRSALQLAAGPSGRLARRLALAATVVAVLLPGVLPGFGADPLIDVDGGGGRIALNPLVDIRPNLLRNPAVELFTVQAERPAYWRLQALDEYTGRFWRASDPSGELAIPIGEGGMLPRPTTTREGVALTQQVRVTRLGGRYLPAAHEPVAVATDGVELRHDAARSSLIAPEGLPETLEYEVVSQLLAPRPEELDRPFDFSSVDPGYLALPEEMPGKVRRVAATITAGAGTPYRQALAIQNYLRNFTYDLEAPAGHGTDDLLHFLQTRRGYCEQFAGTMAVMLRALGNPARVAIGFLPGTADENGLLHVTTEEAHAWVEMFFPGYGWLPFEPTPTRSNPTAPYLSADISTFPGPEGVRGPRAFEPGGRAQSENPQLAHVELRHGGGSAAGQGPGEGDPSDDRRILVLLGLLAALLAIAAIPARKWASRRRRLRRAREPAALVLASFDVLEQRAADLGLGRRPEETVREYEGRLRATVSFSNGDLERMTALVGRAAYGRADMEELHTRAASESLRSLTDDLRRHAGRRRTLVGAFRPVPPDPS